MGVGLSPTKWHESSCGVAEMQKLQDFQISSLEGFQNRIRVQTTKNSDWPEELDPFRIEKSSMRGAGT
jgi:hypothetical protein